MTSSLNWLGFLLNESTERFWHQHTHSGWKQPTLLTSHLAPYCHDEVLLELLAAEAVLAFFHGGRQPPTLPNGSVPHPLLLPPLALPLCCTRHKHVIQCVVVAICLAHHLESRVGWGGVEEVAMETTATTERKRWVLLNRYDQFWLILVSKVSKDVYV